MTSLENFLRTGIDEGAGVFIAKAKVNALGEVEMELANAEHPSMAIEAVVVDDELEILEA